MTRKLVLINLSSHLQEEYEIGFAGKPTRTLAPGDKVFLFAEEQTNELVIEPVDNPDKPDEIKEPTITAYLAD